MKKTKHAIEVYGGTTLQDRDNFGCLAFAHIRALGLIGMRYVERQMSGPEGLLWVRASVRTLGSLLPVWSTLGDDLITASSITGGGERQERLVHTCLMLAHLVMGEDSSSVLINQCILRAVTDGGSVRSKIEIYSRPVTDADDGTPISEIFPTGGERSLVMAIRIPKLLSANPERILTSAAGRVARWAQLREDVLAFGAELPGTRGFCIKSKAARRVLLYVACASGHETKTLEALEAALLVGADTVSIWN